MERPAQSPRPPQPTSTPKPTTRVLFVCGKNRWRSPTAERVFADHPDHPDIECLSAGLSPESPTPVST
ncbi:MAG: hypothetical protein KIT54_04645 [Phycisphaeraceae bacterium]|nr:hypothetical protein [Phycisphaeraceae bacterium]